MDRVHFYGFIMYYVHFYMYNAKFNVESNGTVKISFYPLILIVLARLFSHGQKMTKGQFISLTVDL